MRLVEGDLSVILESIERLRAQRLQKIAAHAQEVADEVTRLSEGPLRAEDKRVPLKLLDQGYKEISREFQSGLTDLIQRLENFYSETVPTGWELSAESGVFYKQRILPFKRIGIFVPASPGAGFMLLHVALPAKLAGVKEIALASPIFSDLGDNLLFAYVCKVLGIKEMYSWGDVEAVYCFTYGAEGFAPVDRIFAMGGSRLQCAKRQSYGFAGLDQFFGTPEVGILIDDSCDEIALCRAIEDHFFMDPEVYVSVFCVSNKKASQVINAFIDFAGQSQAMSDQLKTNASQTTHLFVTGSGKDAVKAINHMAPTVLYVFGKFSEDLVEELTGPCYVINSEKVLDRKIDPYLGPCFIGKTCGAARFSSTLKMINFTKSVDSVTVDSKEIEDLSKIPKLFRELGKIRPG